MGVVRVPMVNRDPVELRLKIAFRVLHQITGEGTQIGHVWCIFWGNDEPKMMPIIAAALGEVLFIGKIACGVEHSGIPAVTRNALPAKIADVAGERRGSKVGSVLADYPCAHHNPSGIRTQIQGRRRPPATSEVGISPTLLPATKSSPRMASFFRRAHDLSDEGFVPDTARPNT